MDWNKYNQIPTEFKTAAEIGLAAATLGAFARRGMVETLDSKPKKYRRIDNPAIKIFQLYEENKSFIDGLFPLWKKDTPIGMMCSMSSGGDVLDCWGNKYDLTNVYKIKFRTKEFLL